MSQLHETFAAAVRAAREAWGFSQAQLAHWVSVCADPSASRTPASFSAASRRGCKSLRSRCTIRRSTSLTSSSESPGRYEADAALVADEDAVRDDAVEVDIEVEGATESLHDGHRAHPWLRQFRSPRTPAVQREDRAQRHVERAGDEQRVAGEEETRPTRQREHPLAHGQVREQAVHEVGRSPLHPAGGAGRTECAAFTGQGDQHLVVAGRAARAG